MKKARCYEKEYAELRSTVASLQGQLRAKTVELEAERRQRQMLLEGDRRALQAEYDALQIKCVLPSKTRIRHSSDVALRAGVLHVNWRSTWSSSRRRKHYSKLMSVLFGGSLPRMREVEVQSGGSPAAR